MKNSPFISIIIPVYNVENYIDTCLNSILKQKNADMSMQYGATDFEIILIDDGSTDGSGEMCDKYAEKYDFASVIHKENGGAADARNTGINHASGEYLLFIDADDFISESALGKITAQIKTDGGCDVTFLNADTVSKNNTVKKWAYTYNKKKIYNKSRGDVLKYLVSLSRFPVSPCIKLLKRSFVIEKNIFFTKGIVCEDVDHMISVLLNAETFNCCNFPYYYARVNREGSVMSSKSRENCEKRFNSTFFIVSKWIKTASENPEFKNTVFGFLAVQYIYLAAMYRDISPSEKKKRKKELIDLSWLLNYGKSKKILLIRIFYKIFGFNMFSKAMGYII